jgi:hypothetical protein
MGRYDIPEPKCQHKQMATRVSSHESIVDAEGPTASVWVCAREECVTDAKEWVKAKTGREPVVVTK